VLSEIRRSISLTSVTRYSFEAPGLRFGFLAEQAGRGLKWVYIQFGRILDLTLDFLGTFFASIMVKAWYWSR
jgi:hypothetical protein